MKKIILAIICLLLCSLLLVPFFSDKVHAQDKKPLNCEQLIKILGSKECPQYVMTDYSVWCAPTEEELLRYYTDEYGDPHIEHLYKNRASDYAVDPSITLEELNSCGVGLAEGQGANSIYNSRQSQSDQTRGETEQNKPSKDTNPAQALNDWITDTFGFFDPYEIKTIPTLSDQATYMDPKITGKNEAELSDNAKNTKKESPYSIGFINSYAGVDSLVKYPGSNEYVPLGMGQIPSGSTIKTEGNSIGIFVGTKGIVYVSADTEVTITHEGLDKIIENSTTQVNEFYLHEGELEVKTIQGNDKESVEEEIVIVTDLVDLIVHSHFWVSQNQNQTEVGVYEGEVDIKVRGSDTSTLVSPNGDKPGIVVVAKKLSVIKLVLAGLVSIAVIAGVVFFLKRKSMKMSNRQKGKKQ